MFAQARTRRRNSISYGTCLEPDAGRLASLGPLPGDKTNMNHWVLWSNDYPGSVKAHGASGETNGIVMFKSCYPISDVVGDGQEPGDPFSSAQTLANYKAVYRHPDGPGSTYERGGHVYKPLGDVFAVNPQVLFVAVTAPPLHFAPADATTDQNAHRARTFNTWLKSTWLAWYRAEHPGVHNVAVFDWFDALAYPDDHVAHPNRLKAEFGGESGDSHPNRLAGTISADLFAAGPSSSIDEAWHAFGVANAHQRVVTICRSGRAMQAGG